MSSMLRNMQRRVLRRRSDYQSAPQPTRIRKDGGYETLRPTLGWLEMSALRIVAAAKMAELLSGHFVMPRPKKPSKTYRKPTVPQQQVGETRQQIRARHRGYVGLGR